MAGNRRRRDLRGEPVDGRGNGTVDRGGLHLRHVAAAMVGQRGSAGPNVWYEVTAVNPAGVSGPASAAFQMKNLTLDDNAADFSQTHTHAAAVTIDTSTPSLFAGDVARMAFGPSNPYAYVVWQAAGPVQTVEALAYYSPNADGLTIQLSTDDSTWVNVPASDVQVQPLLVGRAATPSRSSTPSTEYRVCCPAPATSRCCAARTRLARPSWVRSASPTPRPPNGDT